MSERSQVSWGALVGLLAILVGCVFMITTYKRQDARMVFDCLPSPSGIAMNLAKEEIYYVNKSREIIQACQNLVEELN